MTSTKQEMKKTKQATKAKDKELLSAKENIIKIKRGVLKIVESMLEENISKDWFLSNCVKLCQGDYEDVTQERSITNLCGYPMCSKTIKKVIKQQYHISRTTNKVYDLAERKCFCSNECYKASNFVKAQLSSVPLYMRKEESTLIHMISEDQNKGSAGEEVLFHHTLKVDDLEKTVITKPTQNNLLHMLQEDVKNCFQHLSDLKITEKQFEYPGVLNDDVLHKRSQVYGSNESESESESDTNNDDEDDYDKSLFPDHDNASVLSDKLMPVHDGTKKAVLISALNPKSTSESSSMKLPIESIRDVFSSWFTEDTLKYLLGERKFYSLKADLLFHTMVNSDISDADKLASVKDEYINLCLKIDKLQEEEEEVSDSADYDIDLTSDGIQSSSMKEEPVDTIIVESLPKSNLKKRSKRKNPKRIKTVSFASVQNVKELPKGSLWNESEDKSRRGISSEKTNGDSMKENVTETIREPIFPLIDSLSQNTLRRQVLISRLKAVYFDKLPLIGLHFRDIRNEIIGVTETFSLTPSNIIFKPKEWKCIALILFRVLTKTLLKDLYEKEKFSQLCEDLITPLNLSLELVEELVSELISSNHSQRSQGQKNL